MRKVGINVGGYLLMISMLGHIGLIEKNLLLMTII